MSNLTPAIVLEGLPVSQFDSSFPFHFIINKELEIVSEGNCLKKILSIYNSTKFLTHIFKVESNSIPIEPNFKNLSKNINKSTVFANPQLLFSCDLGVLYPQIHADPLIP